MEKSKRKQFFSDFCPLPGETDRSESAKGRSLGYTHHPYDALLDEYEPGMKASEVKEVFGRLRNDLVPLVEAILHAPPPDDSFLHNAFREKSSGILGWM